MLEPRRNVEAGVSDDDETRECTVRIHECDARPLARVTDDHTDDERDHNRIGDECYEEGRRPADHAHVLAEEQDPASHATPLTRPPPRGSRRAGRHTRGCPARGRATCRRYGAPPPGCGWRTALHRLAPSRPRRAARDAADAP